MDTKRLYRSRTNRIICGVCGGVGEYFGVDPTIIRFACTGSGIVAYFIAAVIMPDQPA